MSEDEVVGEEVVEREAVEADARDGDPGTHGDEDATPASGRGKRWAIALGVLVSIGILTGGLLLLFLPAPQLALQERPPKGTPYIDALVLDVDDQGFDLLTQRRQREQVDIREPDRELIDVQHAKSHASLGQPVRIFYAGKGDDRYVVYMEDSPLIF